VLALRRTDRISRRTPLILYAFQSSVIELKGAGYRTGIRANCSLSHYPLTWLFFTSHVFSYVLDQDSCACEARLLHNRIAAVLCCAVGLERYQRSAA
jgi:hypothetical protein